MPRRKHNTFVVSLTKTASSRMSRSMSLRPHVKQTSISSAAPSSPRIRQAVILPRQQLLESGIATQHWAGTSWEFIENELTECFRGSSTVRRQKLTLRHLHSRTASVTRAWRRRRERKILRQHDGCIRVTRSSYSDLENSECVLGILSKRRQDTSLAAVGDSHALRR